MKSIMATVIRINGTSHELKYRWITVLALIEFAKELKHSLQISKNLIIYSES